MYREIIEVERECGFRQEGGFYFKTAEGGPNGTIDPFVIINPPIPLQRKPHRGPILVDGNAILRKDPEDTWVVGSSAKTVETNKANDFWTELFGMTLTQRLSKGDCAGMERAEDAYEHLLKIARYSRRVDASMRLLATWDLQNFPNMANLYARLTRQMFAYAYANDIAELVKIGATVWEMYGNIKPSKRKEAVPLAHMLISLGFEKDGREMLAEISAG